MLIDRNQVSDISALADLSNLRVLSLTDNQVADIVPLVDNTSLVELFLDRNQLSNISALGHLPKLKFLSLTDNQITDISPLVDNPNIDRWDDVDLTGNPLDSASRNTRVIALRERGVIVTWDVPAP